MEPHRAYIGHVRFDAIQKTSGGLGRMGSVVNESQVHHTCVSDCEVHHTRVSECDGLSSLGCG